MQSSKVIIPPRDIHHLQRETLQRYFHGLSLDAKAWILFVLCSGFALLSSQEDTVASPVGMTGQIGLDTVTAHCPMIAIANPIYFLRNKQIKILGGNLSQRGIFSLASGHHFWRGFIYPELIKALWILLC